VQFHRSFHHYYSCLNHNFVVHWGQNSRNGSLVHEDEDDDDDDGDDLRNNNLLYHLNDLVVAAVAEANEDAWSQQQLWKDDGDGGEVDCPPS